MRVCTSAMHTAAYDRKQDTHVSGLSISHRQGFASSWAHSDTLSANNSFISTYWPDLTFVTSFAPSKGRAVVHALVRVPTSGGCCQCHLRTVGAACHPPALCNNEVKLPAPHLQLPHGAACHPPAAAVGVARSSSCTTWPTAESDGMGLPAVAGWESAAVDGASPSEPAPSVFMLELAKVNQDVALACRCLAASSCFTRVLQPRMRLTGKSAYSRSVCVQA